MRPPTGMMYWWRFRGDGPQAWRFGYCTDAGNGLIRMGAWNGDTTHGSVVSPHEIEWKEYR